MKSLLILASALTLSAATGWSQGYEAQYPYDPYGSSAQPTTSSDYAAPAASNGGYSTYSNGPSGGDYGGGGGGAVSMYGGKPILSYGSIEGHYAFSDLKDSELEGGHGFGANLKVLLMRPLYLHFGLDRIMSEDARARDFDLTSLSAAAGGYIPLSQTRFHLFGEVGVRYDTIDTDLDTIETDEFSVLARAGLRWAITDRLELAGAIVFNSSDNLGNLIVEVNSYFALLSWLDLGLGVNFAEELNSYQAGARIRW